MNLRFRNKRISGILAVVPANEIRFEDEIDQYNFSAEQSLKLQKVMGYKSHAVVPGEETISDLAVYAFEKLFAAGRIARGGIDALLVVTQSPDHFIPPTSNIIQGRLGLPVDMLCYDINQGCAGYLIGLMQAFMLLDQPSIRRVALVNGDVLSRRVSRQDRNSYPLVGDALSVTILENSADAADIFMSLHMDGTKAGALCIPAGGFRCFSSPETAILHEDSKGNLRAADHLVMDGTEVFNFVMRDVPPLVLETLGTAGLTTADIDCFAFHQPNRFMLEKLADKLKVPRERMPANVVENFGNSSGVTIPVVLALNLADRLVGEPLTLCLSGFGVGLTWAAMTLPTKPLDFAILDRYTPPSAP